MVEKVMPLKGPSLVDVGDGSRYCNRSQGPDLSHSQKGMVIADETYIQHHRWVICNHIIA